MTGFQNHCAVPVAAAIALLALAPASISHAAGRGAASSGVAIAPLSFVCKILGEDGSIIEKASQWRNALSAINFGWKKGDLPESFRGLAQDCRTSDASPRENAGVAYNDTWFYLHRPIWPYFPADLGDSMRVGPCDIETGNAIRLEDYRTYDRISRGDRCSEYESNSEKRRYKVTDEKGARLVKLFVGREGSWSPWASFGGGNNSELTWATDEAKTFAASRLNAVGHQIYGPDVKELDNKYFPKDLVFVAGCQDPGDSRDYLGHSMRRQRGEERRCADYRSPSERSYWRITSTEDKKIMEIYFLRQEPAANPENWMEWVNYPARKVSPEATAYLTGARPSTKAASPGERASPDANSQTKAPPAEPQSTQPADDPNAAAVDAAKKAIRKIPWLDKLLK